MLGINPHIRRRLMRNWPICLAGVFAVCSPSHAAIATDALPQAKELFAKAKQEGSVHVIVLLKEEGTTRSLSAAQTGVIKRLASQFPIKTSAVKTFDIVPGLALPANAAMVDALARDPAVAQIIEDRMYPPVLYQSIPLINADDAWLAGYSGAGQTVAILDTGVNKSHPFLAGKVVSEACYSTSTSGSGWTSTSLCPGGASSSTAADSGLDCDGTTIAGCGHGTHVAGIAAGRNGSSSGGTMSGVARDANVIAVKIFSRFTGSAACGVGRPDPCALSFTSDQIKGLERIYALRSMYQVASANMSLGGGTYTATCDGSEAATKAIIDNLRGAGIATVIASGNDGYPNATGAPGCISTAITVGSTTKSDTLSGFSNSASWVDVLAPGSSICSSVNAGWTANCGGTSYGFASGTSMATPHVTGAWAVMKSKDGTASVTAIENALETKGVAISTPAGSKPRIDLSAALGAISNGPNIGLNWDHCQQTYRALGDSVTWCWLEGGAFWLPINDNEGEKVLIKASSSFHWIGYYVSSISGSSFTVSHVRLWKS